MNETRLAAQVKSLRRGDTLPAVIQGVTVEVPASSANLGPGFDTLGLAVGLRLVVSVRRASADSFRYLGEGHVSETNDNLVHRAFRAACRTLRVEPFPVAIEARSAIPLARGLGSSSAALVAGAAAADVLTGGLLGRDGVFALTAAIEGHPDNVGPAVYGGWTAAAKDRAGEYRARSLPLPSSWRLLFAVPPFELSTETARRSVPDSFSREVTVGTAGRVALWALAVALDEPELLATASQDTLHQPYRSPLLPGFDDCLDRAVRAGAYCAYLSGAGPTVAAICDELHLEAVERALAAYAGANGRVLRLTGAAGYRASLNQELSNEPSRP